ncbi:MAG: hypothetical protein JXR78_19010 [Victivallales bacterium]|nr:hypothetical protein [Victivallales bacterium]
MRTFLGIGLGPIQTGIFVAGAYNGGFDRIVIAEVDKATVAAVRAAGGEVNINIAESDGIRQESYKRIEIYDPSEPYDQRKLIQAAADAEELSTALPGTAFYRHIAPWLCEGFELAPDRRRFIYTAENDNYAAEKLDKAIGKNFPCTYYLNTVVGKMSKAFTPETDNTLVPLCPGLNKGHLVEAFNHIYISSAPEIETRQCHGLHAKSDLLPFEEAKLYGHNAVHFLLGWEAAKAGLTYMSELTGRIDLMEYGKMAFAEESGTALCRKWQDADALFSPAEFSAYIDDLLKRMTNPYLQDAVERIIRDLSRKLELEDRIVGTIRLCLNEHVIPKRFIHLADECFGRLR